MSTNMTGAEKGKHAHKAGHAHGPHGHDHSASPPAPTVRASGGHGHDEHGHGHGKGGHDHGGHGDHGHGDHGDHDHGDGFWAKVKHAVVPHSHDAMAAIQTAEEARSDGIRTAWIGLAGMMVTAVLQVFIVAISGSLALLADTVHNFGHAVTTIPLVIAFKIGAWAPNARYPFGYRRSEDVVGIFIAFIIFLTAVYIAYEAINALVNPRPLTNLGWVLAAGIIGFIGNEAVAVYRIRGGKRIGSAALIAEGQHARADGFTSLAVVAGVIGAYVGFPQADPIIGLFIAAVIVGIMITSLKSILHRLMDGVDKGQIDQIRQVVTGTEGVESVQDVRARWSGHRLLVETAITVDSTLSLADGRAVADATRERVRMNVPSVESTLVEIAPSTPKLAA